MGLMTNILGTLSQLFKIGGKSGIAIKNNSGVAEIKNAGDTALATLRAAQVGASPNLNDVATYFDAMGVDPNIEFGFAGASAPTAGTNTGKFGFCHTSGGSYTAGDVVYDDGTSLIKSNVTKGFTTKSAITGTISLIANGVYKKEGSSFVLKGDGSGTSTGMVLAIELAYTFGSTTVDSTTNIPANARVVRVENVVGTAFNGTSPTVAVTVNGSTPVTIMATTESDLTTVNQYESLAVTDIAAANEGKARLTVSGGSATTGAGKVYVFYVSPLA